MTNDVIITSLPKQWQNGDLLEAKLITYHLKGIDESYQKCIFLLNLGICVKSYRHFCQNLALFTMPAYQIWSCHVLKIHVSNIFYFVLILHLKVNCKDFTSLCHIKELSKC